MRAVEYKSFECKNFFFLMTWKNYLGGPGKPGNDLEFGKLKSLDTLDIDYQVSGIRLDNIKVWSID